jgi:hypothetical protein
VGRDDARQMRIAVVGQIRLAPAGLGVFAEILTKILGAADAS